MTQSTITVQDVSGVLAVIPTMLGFQPEDSVVGLMLAGNRVKLTMRADLDEAPVDELARTVAQAAERSGADSLILVGYVDHPDAHHAELLRNLAIAVEMLAVDAQPVLSVRHLALVGKAGWCELDDWSDQTPRFRPVRLLREHPAALQAHLEDRAVAASRRELVSQVEPGSDLPSVTYEVALEAAILGLADVSEQEAVRLMSEDLDEVLHASPVDDAVLARMTALLVFPEARDAAMLRIDQDNAKVFLDHWARVVRLTSGRAALAALFLAGTAAWVSGDGALMNACGDHGRAINPAHIGPQVFAMITSLCLPPEAFDRMKDELLRERSA